MMKLTPSQIQRLAEKILNQWISQNLITFKVEERIVLQTIKDTITADLRKEEELDKEVNAMIEKIQSEHGGDLQRHKMFPMLKQKIAKERKMVL